MSQTMWREWAAESRERIQKRAKAIDEPNWVDITQYGIRRSTKPLDADLLDRVLNAGFPKGAKELEPDDELWATQHRVNATKVDTIPFQVDRPIVMLRFKDRDWIIDGHHRLARARKERRTLKAVVYNADLQVAKHLKDTPHDHDQQSHASDSSTDRKVVEGKDGRTYLLKDESRYGVREVAAYSGNVLLGQLSWSKNTGDIGSVSVRDDARRKGLATLMLEYARELDPNVKHSRSLTEDGRAWSEVAKHDGSSDVVEVDFKRRVRKLLGRVSKSVPEIDPAMESHVTEHMNRNFGADLGNRTVAQVKVNADNLTERDGIHHRTGGRWKKQSLVKRIAKHLQGEHDQKTHGRRGPAQVHTFDPPKFVTDAVNKWFEDHGGKRPDIDWHDVRQDHKFQMRIADAYDKLPMYDKSAESSFRAMARETEKQFRFLTDVIGVKFQVVDSDPYRNVRDLVWDVKNNRTLKVLGTKHTGGHPFFSNEVNDKFRFVHDFFGHVATGRDFDRHGEEAAYLHHRSMFSEEARAAMTSETRGQNASLIKNRDFPPQKVALLPETLSKHLLGQHDQKTHGRWAHDSMRFAAEVLGQEVKWSRRTWINPSGNTMMDILGNPGAREFFYKTSPKHPGMALVWNSNTKQAGLLSRRKGQPTLRTISGPERIFRRGQLLYGKARAGRERGEQVVRDIDRLIPDDLKVILEEKGREAASGVVARHARRTDVNKSIKELLTKHEGPGEHPGTGTSQQAHAGGEGGQDRVTDVQRPFTREDIRSHGKMWKGDREPWTDDRFLELPVDIDDSGSFRQTLGNAVRELRHWHLADGRTSARERGYLIDPKTGKVKHASLGVNNGVVVAPQDAEDGRYRDHMFIHLHPSSRSISGDDMMVGLRYGIPHMVAVSGDSIFSLRIKDGDLGREWQRHLEADRRVRNRFTSRIDEGKLSVDDANHLHGHNVWTDLATRFPETFTYTHVVPSAKSRRRVVKRDVERLVEGKDYTRDEDGLPRLRSGVLVAVDVDTDYDEVSKHLPGEHDQQAHGNRRPVTQSKFLRGRLDRQGGYGYQPIFRDTPRRGKAVSLAGFEVETSGVPTRSNIANYISKHLDLLQSKPDHYVGGWYDERTGRGYLDIHVVVDSDEEAQILGREHGQIAYYDLDNDREVEIKGGREKRG